MTPKTLQVAELLERLRLDVLRVVEERQLVKPLVVGIHTGGAWIAEHVHRWIAADEPVGFLDISFYRDDFSRIGVQPEVKPSHLPFNVDERNVILVDDVLHTGRTIRAALNELFDYGRPDHVVLAVLIERTGRQIPIRADCVGIQLDLAPHERVKLTGPDPLDLVFAETRHLR